MHQRNPYPVGTRLPFLFYVDNKWRKQYYIVMKFMAKGVGEDTYIAVSEISGVKLCMKHVHGNRNLNNVHAAIQRMIKYPMLRSDLAWPLAVSPMQSPDGSCCYLTELSRGYYDTFHAHTLHFIMRVQNSISRYPTCQATPRTNYNTSAIMVISLSEEYLINAVNSFRVIQLKDSSRVKSVFFNVKSRRMMQYKDWLDRYKDLVRFNMDLDSFITKYQYRRPSQWGHLALMEIAQDLPSQALRVSDISTVRSDIRELAGLKFERIVIIAVDIDKGVIRNLLPDSLKSTIEF